MATIKPSQQTWRLAALALATSLALTACGGDKAKQAEAQKQAAAAQQQAPLPVVGVVTVYPENVLLENNLPGRLESQRSADIIPQASGIVKKRLFQEGSFVRAGQPLYELDDENYVASLASARASLLTAEAQLAKANADLERYRPLLKADAISKQEWDAAVTAKRSAEAQIEAAKASIQSANVSLKHTQIVAPISGIIGQSLVTEGALVTANSTKMVNITQNDPLYVNITQSSADMLKLRQQLASGEKVLGSPEVTVTLEDGTVYPHKGRFLFSNPKVDEKTGQITIRASIPNPNQMLMSGMYVRVNLPLAGILNAFVVPQQAVTRGTPDTVMIVNAQGGMEPRVVKIGGQRGSDWVISEGLQAGDKVIVDGIMIAGMMGAKKVQTKEWTPPAQQQAPAGMGAAPTAAPASAASSAAAPAQEEPSDIQAASAASAAQ